jgi:hypothetical protein
LNTPLLVAGLARTEPNFNGKSSLSSRWRCAAFARAEAALARAWPLHALAGVADR